jgi:hypothetical protein
VERQLRYAIAGWFGDACTDRIQDGSTDRIQDGSTVAGAPDNCSRSRACHIIGLLPANRRGELL